jgi:hypothetical protein
MEFSGLFSKETLAKIANAAPLLGSILGPGGAIAGTGIKLIASALGVEEAPAAIEAALETNPDALLKLKELEASHRIELEKFLLEHERVHLADVQNARAREIAIVQATGKRDLSMETLGWIITTGFFAVLIVRMFVTIPTNQLENVGMLIGALISAFLTVVQYKYGSSKGSADKSATLSALAGEKKQ